MAYYSVAMSVKKICEAIVRDEKSILPVSLMIHGAYGIEGIALSMPVIVGKDGIESEVPVELIPAEAKELQESAAALK